MPVFFPPLGSQTAVASGGMVPTYIAPTEVFTVPVNRQALFAMLIENDGTLIVDGYLVEVN